MTMPTRTPMPSITDKLRRGVWQVSWLLLYRPTPVFAHVWRRVLLRIFGAKIGAGAHPYPSARIWAPWNLVMDARSCLGSDSECYNVAAVILRHGSVVSQRAYLCTASHDLSDAAFTLTSGSIEIGPRAWVAASAFIGPGVTLGAGAVAAACAVVVRDVAAGDVVAGNPARVVSNSLLAVADTASVEAIP